MSKTKYQVQVKVTAEEIKNVIKLLKNELIVTLNKLKEAPTEGNEKTYLFDEIHSYEKAINFLEHKVKELRKREFKNE